MVLDCLYKAWNRESYYFALKVDRDVSVDCYLSDLVIPVILTYNQLSQPDLPLS